MGVGSGGGLGRVFTENPRRGVSQDKGSLGLP